MPRPSVAPVAAISIQVNPGRSAVAGPRGDRAAADADGFDDDAGPSDSLQANPRSADVEAASLLPPVVEDNSERVAAAAEVVRRTLSRSASTPQPPDTSSFANVYRNLGVVPLVLVAALGLIVIALLLAALQPRGTAQRSLEIANMPLLWVHVCGLHGERQEVMRFSGNTASSSGAPPPPSVRDLRLLVAARLGVDPMYVVLYARGPAVVNGQITERLPSLLLTPLGTEKAARFNATYLASERARQAREEAASLISRGLVPGGSVTALVRPLRGDHIHVAFAMFHGGRLLKAPQDRPLTGRTSEGRHVENLFPHFGVHTGGPGFYDDGVLHIHPGTSWQWFSGTEGFGCTLGAFLEQVGVVIWSPDSMRYPNHHPVAGMPRGVTCIDAASPLAYDDDAGNSRSGGEFVRSSVTWSPAEYAENHTIVCDSEDAVWRVYVWDRLWPSAAAAGGGGHTGLGPPPSPTSFYEPGESADSVGLDRVWMSTAESMLSLSYERRSDSPWRRMRRDLFTAAQQQQQQPSSQGHVSDGNASSSSGSSGSGGGDSVRLLDRSASLPIPRLSTVRAIHGMTPDGFDGRLYPQPDWPMPS